MNLIYDRTEQDVETARTQRGTALTPLKGCYNITDLNRVESAVKTLSAALTAAGYPVEVTPVLKGSSRVPSGYTEVEWIQSSGGQYIDTGVVGTGGVRVLADVIFTAITTSSLKSPLFGAHNAGEPYGRSYLGISSDHTPEVGGGSGYRYYKNNTITAGERYTIDANNTPGGEALSLNGTALTATGGAAYSAPYSGNTLWVFAVNTSNTSWFEKASAKLYSMAIYADGTTLVRDFIPCKNPEGTVGLYDLVEGQFYGNSGTGTFTAGAEVGKAEDREWQEGDVLYRPQWTMYLNNVQKLRDAYYTLAETGQLPKPEDKLEFEGANTIEKILADIDQLIDCMKASYRRCGTFRAGNNAVHLPLKGSI